MVNKTTGQEYNNLNQEGCTPIKSFYASNTQELQKRRKDPGFRQREKEMGKWAYNEDKALESINLGLFKRCFLDLFGIASLEETNPRRVSYNTQTEEYSFNSSDLLETKNPVYMRRRIREFNNK